MRDYLRASLREDFDFYPVSTYDDIIELDTPETTGERNHFRMRLRFLDSKDIPFEIWADNEKPSYDEMHYECLLGDNELRQIIQEFKSKEESLDRERSSSQTSRSPSNVEFSWIYGTWSITTPYGTETMKLEESGRILDMVGMDMQIGTFTYEDGELKVRFPENKGMVFTYELDMAGHRISIGEGQYMHKRDSNEGAANNEVSQQEDGSDASYSDDEYEESVLIKKFESDYYSQDPSDIPLFTPEFSQLMDKVEALYWEKYEDAEVGYFDYDVFTQGQELIRYSHIEAKVVDDKGKVTIKREDDNTIVYSNVKTRGELVCR